MSGPTGPQIANAIGFVHKAFHDSWPYESAFMNADIEPRVLFAWVSQHSKAREGWRDHVETVVEQLAIAPSVEGLAEMVRMTCDGLQQSAREFEEEMANLLDE